MEKSTHYKLNLPQGSDKFNPLTVDRPNTEKIDTVMFNNALASVQQANHVKKGDAHAITVVDPTAKAATMLRFVATADFTVGDTFTVNGAAVSAVLPDGSGLSTNAFRTNSTVLCSVIGSRLTVYTNSIANTAENALKLGGNLPEYYGKASDSLKLFVDSYIGRTHNFTIDPEAIADVPVVNGQLIATSPYREGDAFTINSAPVNVVTQDGEPLPENFFVAGAYIRFIVEGSNIYFFG